jgi:uncharacterized YigZ family protein
LVSGLNASIRYQDSRLKDIRLKDQRKSEIAHPKSEIWKTVSSQAEGIYKEKGSRFISYLFPVANEDEIKQILLRIKKEHHSARHHCYAWQLGTEEMRSRSNDDGEPSSTAGKPILSQIIANDLTNVLMVVVRYFGGTLLGTSGLINAYRSAAADAISNSTIETRDIEFLYRIECPYSLLNQVFQIIHSEGYHPVQTTSEEKCTVDILVKKSGTTRAESLFGSIYGVSFQKQVC